MPHTRLGGHRQRPPTVKSPRAPGSMNSKALVRRTGLVQVACWEHRQWASSSPKCFTRRWPSREGVCVECWQDTPVTLLKPHVHHHSGNHAHLMTGYVIITGMSPLGTWALKGVTNAQTDFLQLHVLWCCLWWTIWLARILNAGRSPSVPETNNMLPKALVMIPSHPRSSFGKSGSLLRLSFLISKIKIINSAPEWMLHHVLY